MATEEGTKVVDQSVQLAAQTQEVIAQLATVQSLASTRQVEKAAQDLNELARSLTGTVEQYQL
jgi:methyl-accepting chemotaxis protein